MILCSNDVAIRLRASRGANLRSISSGMVDDLECGIHGVTVSVDDLSSGVILNFLVKQKPKTSVGRSTAQFDCWVRFRATRPNSGTEVMWKIDHNSVYMGKIRLQSFGAKYMKRKRFSAPIPSAEKTEPIHL